MSNDPVTICLSGGWDGNNYIANVRRLTMDNTNQIIVRCDECKTLAMNERCFHGYKELSMDFYHNMTRGAKSRKLDVTVTIEELWELFVAQERKCALSGQILTLSRNNKKNKGTASIDRIDSSKGYHLDNVQWIHKDINIMKYTFGNEHFIGLCKMVGKNNAT